MKLILAWIVSLPAGGGTIFCCQEAPGLDAINRAIQDRQYPKAEQLSLERVSRIPEDALGWFYLGYSRVAQNKFQPAIQPYQEAIRLGLKDFKAHYQLGFCSHKAGSHLIAGPAFEAALALKPEDPDALYYLGVTQYELGEDALAEETFTGLLGLKSRWTELARFHRALVRYRAGRRPEAEEDLHWILRESQNDGLKDRAQKLLTSNLEPSASDPGKKHPQKPWSVAWLEKAGYDSNHIQNQSQHLIYRPRN